MSKKLLSAVVLSISVIAIGIMPLLANAQVAPTITAISPTSVAVGIVAPTLTVSGSNFVSGSVIEFNGAPLNTNYISPTELSATIPAVYLASASTYAVYVSNPGGLTSGLANSLIFTITSTATTTPNLPNTGFNPNNLVGLNIMTLFEAVIASSALLFLGIKLKKRLF